MKVPIHTTPATLWDGQRQLPGRLELWEYKLIFHFENFQDSHLSLVIPLWEILKVEEFLLFEVTRNGLRVENVHGKSDAFVLEDAQGFKKTLLAQIKKNQSG